MDYEQINNFLKRPLQNGTRYERYFKHSSCTPYYIGTGDTSFHVRQMQKMVYKNTSYTKSLSAAEFAHLPFHAIPEKVHEFLFNHIQYELDTFKQNLKSPQCTWASREVGTDCKSCSIFASAILCNLGIKHLIRRVKQPNPDFARTQKGINPDLWSHVYVAVPKNQKTLKAENPGDYFIIDATVEGNREGAFSKKHDTKMTKVSLPAYGLQSPSPRGMGACSCEEIPKTVVEARPVTTVRPTATTTVVRRTTDFQKRVAAARTANVSRTTSRGGIRSPFISPNPYGLGNSDPSNSQKGANYAGAAIQLYQAGQTGASNNRIATSQGSREQRLDAIGKSGATSSIIYGVGGAAAAFTYGITALLALVPAEWYENKIGQLFEGFSCVGSSWTPKTGKAAFIIEAEFVKNRAAQTLQSFQGKSLAEVERIINDFWVYFYNVQSGSRRWLADSAKDCTKKGLEVIVTSLDVLKKEELEPTFLKSISATGHLLVKNGTKTVTYGQNPDNGYPGGHPSFKIKVPQYKIQVNTALLPAPEAAAERQFQNTQTKKKSSTAIGVAAMAALAFISI